MFNLSVRLIPQTVGLLTRELNVPDVHRILRKHTIFSEKNCPYFNIPKNANLVVNPNFRYYAKSRDIKKEKKKQVKFDENELREYLDVEKLFTDLGKPLEFFKEELVKHATLRTSPNAIENVKINFEGGTYTIRDLAEVGKKSSKLYVLDFTSFPAVIPTVVATLQKLELNLNVQQDGTKIFVPLPSVTREHRELLARKSKLCFHKCKESIRNVQNMYRKSLNNIEKLPDEAKFRITDQLTVLGDKQISLAEEILKAKHAELLKE